MVMIWSLDRRFLHVQGQEHLLDLPFDLSFAGQEEVAGQLLGQGRGAALPADGAGSYGAHDGPQHGLGIDPAVVVELGVLDGDDGQLEMVRDGVGREFDPTLQREGAENLAVAVHEAGGGGGTVGGELVQGGEVQRAGHAQPLTAPTTVPATAAHTTRFRKAIMARFIGRG
jgi:hypothetical protein